MEDSILVTIKKMLGLDAAYTAFDLDIITDINMAFLSLQQIGVGPVTGFSIRGYDETWDSFLTNNVKLDAAKTYIYLKVKTVFDPPNNSFVMDAFKTMAQELEWRLNVQAEGGAEVT